MSSSRERTATIIWWFPVSWKLLSCVAVLALSGCAVAGAAASAATSVAGAAAGAAVSIGGAAVSTGITLTGKVVGAGIDAFSSQPGEDTSGIIVRERVTPLKE